MNKTILAAATAALTLTALPTAVAAQPWQNLNARQDRLFQRIERGVETGQLTRGEAGRLRARFVRIERMERDYRRSGGRLDRRERADLDRRFDALAVDIRGERRDRQYRR